MSRVIATLAAIAALLFCAQKSQACDAAFGVCGQQQQVFAAPIYAAPMVQQQFVPVQQQVVQYAVPVQQQIVQRQFVPVQKQVFAQQYAVAAPVVRAPVVRAPRLRLFGGRQVARSRSVVRGGGASAQAQAGAF